MLVGEYPFDETMKEGFVQRLWYALYTFLIFITAMNIIMAMVVDAFSRIHAKLDEFKAAHQNILKDMVSLFKYWLKARRKAWPSRGVLLRFLEERASLPYPMAAD